MTDLLALENGVILGTLVSTLSSLFLYYYTQKKESSIEAYENIYKLSNTIREKGFTGRYITENAKKSEYSHYLDNIYKKLKSSPFESNDQVHTKLLVNLGLLYLSVFNDSKEKIYLEKGTGILDSSLDKIDFKSNHVEYFSLLIILGQLYLKLSELENRAENLEKASKIFRRALDVVTKNPSFFESKGALEYVQDTSILNEDNLSPTFKGSTSLKLSELINFYINTADKLKQDQSLHYDKGTDNAGA